MNVLVGGRAFLEAPRWHEGRFWMSDIFAGQVIAVALDGTVDVMAEIPGQPCGLGWLPDGRLLVVAMTDRTILRLESTGELVVHADLAGHTKWPLNDMVVDGTGRAYVGGLGFDFPGFAPIEGTTLSRVDPDGGVTAWGEDLVCPNGLVVTADGSRLIVAESFGARLTCFDIAADGALGNQRVWADFGAPDTTDVTEYVKATPVLPDGICIDAEGCVWVADPVGRRAIRVRPGGEIVDEVPHRTPIFACALGGDDGRDLVLCTAPAFADTQGCAEALAVRVATGRAQSSMTVP